jgi:hypothetical protein
MKNATSESDTTLRRGASENGLLRLADKRGIADG